MNPTPFMEAVEVILFYTDKDNYLVQPGQKKSAIELDGGKKGQEFLDSFEFVLTKLNLYRKAE